MQLLRIKLFQETVCYLKPMAFKVGETYPLAPFSTVKGMIHAVLKAREYLPMRLSIQGLSESLVVDYQKKYMFKMRKKEIPIVPSLVGLDLRVELDSQVVTTMPMYQHLLFNMEHVIHIDADNDVLQRLFVELSSLKTPLSLGRWEDVVRIDEVSFVKVRHGYTNKSVNDQFRLLPEKNDFSEVINKTVYRLPKKYDIIEGQRQWSYVDVFLLPAHELSVKIPCLLDEDDLVVALLE